MSPSDEESCEVAPVDAAGPNGTTATLSHAIFAIFFFGCLYMALRILLEVQKVRSRMGKLSKRVTLGEVLSYRADLYFSSDPLSKPIALLCMTQVLILVGGFLLYACSPDGTLPGKMWQAWVFIADSAAHSDYGGITERIVSFILTICGMLVFGFLVGIVTDTIGEKVDQLKKGKSAVLESGHTLILNWSNKVIPVIDEICQANESVGGGTVVVLAERDKEEMEQEILESLSNLRNTKVVVRSGSPILAMDLNKVAAPSARAIIVMSQENLEPDESDAMALRVSLSLTSMEKMAGHITVELSDIDNRHLIELVGRKRVETIVSHDLIGRIMIQCARQPGLARVLDGLLGFEGHEFYFSTHPELDGKTFEDALYMLPEAVVLGIKPKDCDRVILNPDGDMIFQPGDELLVLAEDDDTYEVGLPSQEELKSWTGKQKDLPKNDVDKLISERVLFIGWRRDLDDMIVQLDEYVAKGSELVLFSQQDIKQRIKSMEDGGLNVAEDLKNLKLNHVIGNSISRRHLQKLKLHDFDSVLILADEQMELDVTKMDSRSLTTLLLIRDIIHRNRPGIKEAPVTTHNKRKQVAAVLDQDRWVRDVLRGETKAAPTAGRKCTIISEILDPKTKLLIQSGSVSDFVASNELISKALAMVAERQEVSQILQEILSAEGHEVYMRRINKYLKAGESLSFFDVMARCRAYNEILLGYMPAGKEEVILNPSQKRKKIEWKRDDLLITLAED